MPKPSKVERLYEPIWKKIKDTGEAKIKCHPALFSRTVKAVIKEKSNDLGFKVINDHDYFYLDVVKDKEKGTIVFKLKQRFGLEERKKA